MKFKGGSARKSSAGRKSERSLSRNQRRTPSGRQHGLSRFLVVEVLEVKSDGAVRARILSGDKKLTARLPEFIDIQPARRAPNPSLGKVESGDRFFVIQHDRHDFELIRPLPRVEAGGTGVFERTPTGGKIRPLDRSAVAEWLVRPEDGLGALAGELVGFAPEDKGREAIFAKVTARHGLYGSVTSISTAVLRSLEIPLSFTPDVEAAAEAAAARELSLEGRADLRELPFVTIDGSDARDFDDAV
ncbi:MAG: hypothetical protein ORO03_04800, partial [Alphaproteobacteria bacterium]|nr:hypothetical protein [Alphaproteobacteria bacterium]